MNNKCYYCERSIGIGNLLKTRDHIIPICRGGNNGKRNLIPACNECNTLKGGQIPEEFSDSLIYLINNSRKAAPQVGKLFSVNLLELIYVNNQKLIVLIDPYRLKLFVKELIQEQEPVGFDFSALLKSNTEKYKAIADKDKVKEISKPRVDDVVERLLAAPESNFHVTDTDVGDKKQVAYITYKAEHFY